MLINYFIAGWRNLIKSKFYSLINISGLAAGMAIAMLIGLWVFDEVTFNHVHSNYPRIAQVYQNVTFDGVKAPYSVMPIPMATELREQFTDFDKVVLVNFISPTLAYEENKFMKRGIYADADFMDMFGISLIAGSDTRDMNAIFLSQSYAHTLFDDTDPVNKLLSIDNTLTVRVAGVYPDIPRNSDFFDVNFIASWDFFAANDFQAKNGKDNWEFNNYQLYVQMKDGADFKEVSALIKDVRLKRDPNIPYKPEFFLHPMTDWHLRSNWENGVQAGGRIESVRLFGLIGVFIMILACINFMNLSTARSEKRAREIGIRKTMGSARGQVITQLFTETFLVVAFALGVAFIILEIALPFFNQLSGKDVSIPWTNPALWLSLGVFCIATSFFAGSYPALYLSSFQPVSILRGTFRAGKLASLPRKILVVLQFSVSVTLIVCTLIVHHQINYAKSRSVGYQREHLVTVVANTTTLHDKFLPLRDELIQSGAVEEIAESQVDVTTYGGLTTSLEWPGKDPEFHPLFGVIGVSPEFGKVVNYTITAGRDLKREKADENSIVMNETAAKTIGISDIIGQEITLYDDKVKVVGIFKDMLMESPFSIVKPTIFYYSRFPLTNFTMKLSTTITTGDALKLIAPIFQKYDPSAPFNYNFVDDSYAAKFDDEERTASLASVFATLAIFISCLGLLGLTAFVAEQRTKEIAVRKIMGASARQLWQLLSWDFVLLVLVGCLVAVPLSYYYMNSWLAQYDYRINISWIMFALSTAGAVALTLITVSYQTIKAAVMNPVDSLRTE